MSAAANDAMIACFAGIGFLVRVLVVGFAAGYLVTAWQIGSLFGTFIGALEADCLVIRCDDLARKYALPPRLAAPLHNLAEKLQTLLLCELCLTPYVSLILLTGIYLQACWQHPVTLAISHITWAISMLFAAAQIAYMLRRTAHH